MTIQEYNHLSCLQYGLLRSLCDKPTFTEDEIRMYKQGTVNSFATRGYVIKVSATKYKVTGKAKDMKRRFEDAEIFRKLTNGELGSHLRALRLMRNDG